MLAIGVIVHEARLCRSQHLERLAPSREYMPHE
jgi:hypothetical protein